MLEIRKVYTAIEETRIEGGKEIEEPIKMITTMLVMKNPWAGRGFVEDLMPEINEYAPVIGELLVSELFKHIQSADDVEAFGKAAVVGVDGEMEHASAFIHTSSVMQFKGKVFCHLQTSVEAQEQRLSFQWFTKMKIQSARTS
jgi:hypothetical protein